MNIGKHEYKGKTYEFKITRAARKAISESQYDIFEKLSEIYHAWSEKREARRQQRFIEKEEKAAKTRHRAGG